MLSSLHKRSNKTRDNAVIFNRWAVPFDRHIQSKTQWIKCKATILLGSIVSGPQHAFLVSGVRNRGVARQWWHAFHAFHSNLGSRGKQTSISSRTAWSTKRVSGQPWLLHRETLYWETKKKERKEKKRKRNTGVWDIKLRIISHFKMRNDNSGIIIHLIIHLTS